MREIWFFSFAALVLIVGLISQLAGYDQVGIASWYGPGFEGQLTSSGEKFDMTALTAAHKSLPFNTRVRVVDLDTGKSVVVRINDRGPFYPGRIIDLSLAAAQALGTEKKGIARVGLKVIEWPNK